MKVEGEQKEKVEGKLININLLDKNKNVFATLKGYIPDISPNGVVAIQVVADDDIIDAYNFEVVDDD